MAERPGGGHHDQESTLLARLRKRIRCRAGTAFCPVPEIGRGEEIQSQCSANDAISGRCAVADWGPEKRTAGAIVPREFDHPRFLLRQHASEIHRYLEGVLRRAREEDADDLYRITVHISHALWLQEARVPKLRDLRSPRVTEEALKRVLPGGQCTTERSRQCDGSVEGLHGAAGHCQAHSRAGALGCETQASLRGEASYASTKTVTALFFRCGSGFFATFGAIDKIRICESGHWNRQPDGVLGHRKNRADWIPLILYYAEPRYCHILRCYVLNRNSY